MTKPMLPSCAGSGSAVRRAAERRRRASELGAAEFITKPVDFDYLKEQLRQLPSVAY